MRLPQQRQRGLAGRGGGHFIGRKAGAVCPVHDADANAGAAGGDRRSRLGHQASTALSVGAGRGESQRLGASPLPSSSGPQQGDERRLRNANEKSEQADTELRIYRARKKARDGDREADRGRKRALYKESEGLFRQVIRSRPRCGRAYVGLSKTLERQHQLELAVKV